MTWTGTLPLGLLALAAALGCGEGPRHHGDTDEHDDSDAYVESAARPDGISGAWVLAEMNGTAPGPGIAITLAFDTDEGQVGGTSGCNQYFAPFEADANGGFSIGPTGSTRMACPEPVMEAESRFLAALAAVRGYRRGDGSLDLQDGEGTTVLAFYEETAPSED